MRSRPFTTTEIKTIEMLSADHTPSQIAKLINRPACSVHGAIRRYCASLPIRSEKEVSPEEARQVITMRLQGMKYHEIAAATGINKARCGYIYRKYS
ncbi:hypothetical protein [Erwinia sp. V71]|uniref:hypothetical protein n=1 Tax=Erwinia sp. V71 TaxID=3369424 RepID=UPI003F62D55A